jgi:hypothetical protein
MKEWKVRQEVFHRLNRQHDDDLSNFEITTRNQLPKDRCGLVKDILKYFFASEEEAKALGWIYPAKSYVVAICYAHWVADAFDEDFYAVLNDQDLLFGNDPFFVTYDKDKLTYDAVISMLHVNDYNWKRGIVPDVYEYFKEEFQL